MPVSINHATRVIFVPQDFLTHVSGSLYELDVDALRLALKDLEDDPDGITLRDTHRHNAVVSLSGVAYAQTVEIINGYRVEFEDGQYVVRCVGANHNLADVKVPNQVSLVIGNAAGLIEVVSGSGVTEQDKADIVAGVWASVLDGTITAAQSVRLMNAILGGKVSGAGSGVETFRDPADSKNRVVATVDAVGNRTQITRDLT